MRHVASLFLVHCLKLALILITLVFDASCSRQFWQEYSDHLHEDRCARTGSDSEACTPSALSARRCRTNPNAEECKEASEVDGGYDAPTSVVPGENEYCPGRPGVPAGKCRYVKPY